MLKALIFSDIHNDKATLERLMAIEADAYFAAGDLVSWARGLDKMGEVMRPRRERVYVLPGNHESAAGIRKFCERFGFVDFHGAMAQIGGVRFAGLGYSTITPFHTPGEYEEDEIAQRLKKFTAWKPQVLICHSPPLNTPLDRIREGLHGGSRAVREFIEQQQPEHFFCGHIHEAQGAVIQLGATRAMNVGKKGYLLEL
ncbi:MAG: metallophosphoesterase [Acidobacteriota bacterium]|nr:metallophosphoesterase [Acidobacteriota bacterium]